MHLPILDSKPNEIPETPQVRPDNSGEASSGEAIRVKIGGMTCTGCAAGLQRAIEAREDVRQASVSFAAGVAEVVGTQIDAEKLLAAIRDRGFTAELIAESDEAPNHSQIEHQQQANERMWRYRALIGMGMWLPLELLHWTATALHWHGPWMHWLMFFGSLIILLFAGSAFYRSAWRSALRGTTNMDTLISLGATTAFVYSTFVFFGGLDLPSYFAEASGLLGIVSLGHWFEARASAAAGSAVRELLRLQPETAEAILPDGTSKIVPSGEVTSGTRLLVRPGGRIAVDGIVREGESAVDQSIVTGESIPVDKKVGDLVVAGSMNSTGRLVIETTVSGRNTTVARIAALVQKAQTSRAPIQRLADQVSAYFVPIVLSIAAVTFVGWWIAGSIATGVIAAVTVLIISCPCALGLATPMAVMVGTGAASRRGILIRNAEALERIGRSRQIVFDKTGTLTVGQPQLTAAHATPPATVESLIHFAASVEAPSEHPLARAILEAARARGIPLSPVSNFVTLPSRGVRGIVDSSEVIVGRDANATAQVQVDGVVIGTLEMQDQLRSDAREAVATLQQLGLQVSILSGDRASTTQRIAEQAGLTADRVIADATPESKAAHIRSLGPDTIMVGDGLNDAAALATSGIGIAMASGTNVAIESAAVVIPGDRVSAIPNLVQLSRDTLRTIKQNLFFAFFYNAVAIPVAALGLLGDNGPLWAALAMGFSDITVVGNALRLKLRLDRASVPNASDAPQ